MPTNAFAGRRISAPIGLIDIVPTILTYLGDTDGVGLDGRDLAPLIQDDPSALADRPLFFDLDLKRADGTLNVSSGVLTGDVKFISVARPSETELLFDLATDPNERASVRHSEPESAARLKALLDGHRRTGKRRDANVTTAEMGNELGERLEALGYLAPHPSP
jgi:arylsulfatase A-like enzyme